MLREKEAAEQTENVAHEETARTAPQAGTTEEEKPEVNQTPGQFRDRIAYLATQMALEMQDAYVPAIMIRLSDPPGEDMVEILIFPEERLFQ